MTLAMTSDDGFQIGLSPWTVANPQQPGPRSATSLDLRRNIVRYLAVVAGGFLDFPGLVVLLLTQGVGFFEFSHSPNRSPTNNSPERGGPHKAGRHALLPRVRYDDRPITHVAAVTTSRLFCRARRIGPPYKLRAMHKLTRMDKYMGRWAANQESSPGKVWGCRRCAPASTYCVGLAAKLSRRPTSES